MKKTRKIAVIFGRIILAVYLCFGLFLFMSQRSIIYYPDNQDFESCYGFKDYEKLNHNGTRFYYKEGTNSEVLVYYHGNAGSACDRSAIKSIFETSNKHLIFVEYAGYSNDGKKPSYKLILKDVKNIHQFIEDKGFQKTTVYGQSIGTGAASHHAHLGNTDELILVTPFSTLTKLAQSKYKIYPAAIILREKYDNIQWLKDYHNELLIIHGNQDQLIPHTFSEELFETIPSQKKSYLLIPNRGHNDLWSDGMFTEIITEFIDN